MADDGAADCDCDCDWDWSCFCSVEVLSVLTPNANEVDWMEVDPPNPDACPDADALKENGFDADVAFTESVCDEMAGVELIDCVFSFCWLAFADVVVVVAFVLAFD